jgi:hypothetical protein
MNYVAIMNECLLSIKIDTCIEGSFVFGAAGYGQVAEGRPVRMRRLPCCGLGLGWCL